MVLMLSGFGGGLEFMLPIAEELQHYLGDDWCVVSADTPGFGKTPSASGTAADAVDKLANAVIALNASRVVIVGQSSGGMLGLASASKAQAMGQSVAGLCLVGGSQVRFSERISRIPWLSPLSKSGVLAFWTVGAASMRLPYSVRRRVLTNALLRRWVLWPYLAHPGEADPEAVARLLENSGSFRSVKFVRSIRQFDLEDLVDECLIPLALVRGEEDRYVHGGDVSWFVAHANVRRTSVVPNSGHWVNVESFDVLMSELKESIKALGLSTPS